MLNNFGPTTPYNIMVNNAHIFHAFNFRTSHAVRKYFNNENFPIYGIITSIVPCIETFYHFGDNDRQRWDSLFSLYQLPPYQLPDQEPVLSFGLAGNTHSLTLDTRACTHVHSH